MKIVLVHGQNHKECSYHIGRMIADGISGEKEITEFFLPQALNHFCTGCCQCIESDEKCPFYADKMKIMDAVEAADLLIFTTPTYCFHASAPMKSFIDLTFTWWMSHRPRKCMFSKKAVVVSTAAGAGAGSAVKDVRTALFYWGVPYIRSYGIAVQATGWDRIAEKKMEKIRKDTARLARKLSDGRKPAVSLKTRFIFRMMGKMQSSGFGASPAEKIYWEKNGWFSGNYPWKI